jgi:hypothetical protein
MKASDAIITQGRGSDAVVGSRPFGKPRLSRPVGVD